MAGGEPRLGTTATYMRYNDHGTTRLSTEIDILHDRTDNEYRIFSAGSVRKWSKFGLDRPIHPLAVALPQMLAKIEAELVTASGPAEEQWLRQRAELIRGLLASPPPPA